MEVKFWEKMASDYYDAHKAHGGLLSATQNADRDLRAVIKETYPIGLEYIRAVTYDTKSDRYVGTFEGVGSTGGKNSVKLTNEVAVYLLTNKNHAHERIGGNRMVEVFARMENGTVVDVLLMVL